MSFYRTKEWYRLRKKALMRDNHTCVNCGKDVSGKKQSRVDHIVPIKVNPELALELSNLQTFCAGCDNIKHREKFGHEEKPEISAEGVPTDPNHPWNLLK